MADKYSLRRESMFTLIRTGKLQTEGQISKQKRYRAFHKGKSAVNAPLHQVANTAHQEFSKYEEDNTGLQAAHQGEQLAEGIVHTAKSVGYAQKLRKYHKEDQKKFYHKADDAEADGIPCDIDNVKGKRYQEFRDNSSNPISKWRQKHELKKQYLAQRTAQGTTGSTTSATGTFTTVSENTEVATTTAGAIVDKVKYVASENGGTVITVLMTLAVLILLITNISSCTAIIPSTLTTTIASTYPSEDADMLAAEAQYCALEAELQEYLDNYESTHDYDEYIFELDEIEHDAYVLISAITALMDGNAWTIDDVQELLQSLFDQQYILTEEVTTETRTRTETVTAVDEDGNEYEYEEDVEYTYTICTVTLENFDLSHVPAYIMTESQMSLYAVYMSTLGNRADLYPDSEYVTLYYNTTYTTYEIPPEALTNEQFANMIAEAEKYLGYPYVWGGSSPSTSFDCSGFVSWVINNCGNGWSVGRLSANGLLGICTVVSASEAQPGDLIFFQGTYNTSGASHVGIYVGNGMMIHCGNPIQYTSIETSYWQSHFLCYGRLPGM